MSRNISKQAFLAAALLTASGLYAQATPTVDAGSALRENKKAPQLPTSLTPPVSVQAAPSPNQAIETSDPKEVRIYVRRYIVPANSAVTQGEVDVATSDYTRRWLTFTQIRAGFDCVRELYRSKGYVLANTYSPEQTMKDGIIKLGVLEGIVEGVDVKKTAGSGTSISADTVRDRITAAQPIGAAFRVQDAERGLLIASDLVKSPVTAQLSAGKAMGATRVDIEFTPPPAASATLSYDNFGNKQSGRNRAQLAGRFTTGLVDGDEVELGYTYAADLESIRAGFSLPIGNDGFTSGLSYSDVSYDLSGAFTGFSGTAKELRVNGSYPFMRTRSFSFYGDLIYSLRDLENTDVTGMTFPRTLNSFTLGGRIESYDDALGGGMNQIGLNFVAGSSTVDNRSQVLGVYLDSQLARFAEGSYSKIVFTASRLQHLTDTATMLLSLRVQQSSDNLDSSEQDSLGGPYGLRSYANSEATGDKTAVLSLELRQSLFTGFSAKVFFDQGWVKVSNDNSWDASSAENSYSLNSAGVGFDLNNSLFGMPIRASVTYAHSVGDNPALSAGLDAEGSSARDRVWFQLEARF